MLAVLPKKGYIYRGESMQTRTERPHFDTDMGNFTEKRPITGKMTEQQKETNRQTGEINASGMS